MQDFNIALSGLTSCGKTSYAKKLASHFWMTRKSASEILLNLSQELWYQKYEYWEDKHHYWLKEKANLLNKMRILRPELDQIVDERVLKILTLTKWNIIETLTAPVLLKNNSSNILKIYFDVSLETRAKRAYISSDTISLNELEDKVYEKDVISRDIIKKLWWFDIFDKNLIYDHHDIVIDNSEFSEIESFDIIQKEKIKILNY